MNRLLSAAMARRKSLVETSEKNNERAAPEPKRTLGEAAAGRRARGPGGQPPRGKESESSVQARPKTRCDPWRRLPAPECAHQMPRSFIWAR